MFGEFFSSLEKKLNGVEQKKAPQQQQQEDDDPLTSMFNQLAQQNQQQNQQRKAEVGSSSSMAQQSSNGVMDDPLDFLMMNTTSKPAQPTNVSNSSELFRNGPASIAKAQFQNKSPAQPTNTAKNPPAQTVAVPQKEAVATNQWDNESDIISSEDAADGNDGDGDDVDLQLNADEPRESLPQPLEQRAPQPQAPTTRPVQKMEVSQPRVPQAPLIPTQQPVPKVNQTQNAQKAALHDQSPSQQPAATTTVRKRDYLSSFMTLTGDTMKKVVAKAVDAQHLQQSAPAKAPAESDQQTIIKVLKGENDQLKSIVVEQQEKVEDLRDEIEVHKSLEEEAHEDNEELVYKVKYLEELARENGHDIQPLKKIQELGAEKKSLQQQVTKLERQMRLMERLQFSKEQPRVSQGGHHAEEGDDEEMEMFENPKKALNDLKTLFENNKIQFSRSDEARVLTALYTQDKPVVRLYREMLFRKIAQKAIQSADYLFQQTSSKDRNGNQMSKVMLQNKRLLAQNESLKKKLLAAQEYAKKTQEERLHEKVRSKHKLSRVLGKAKDLAEQAAGMRAAILALKTQVSRTQDSLEDEEVLNLNIQRFNSYLSYFLEEQNEKQALKKQEFERQLKSSQTEKSQLVSKHRQQYEEISAQLSQAVDEKTSLQDELGEAHEVIGRLEQQMNRFQEESLSEKTASQAMQNMLQQEIKVLQQRPIALQSQIQTLQTDKSSLEQRTQAMQMEITALQAEVVTLKQQPQALQREIQSLQTEISLLQQRPQALQLEIQALQHEIQTLQQRPQGSPISGGVAQQQVISSLEVHSQEAPSLNQQLQDASQSEAQQQISELEKMLEEREEEICELMDEVNKLQQQKQQSPEVMNTLQILKSKLHHSQQRFQDYQNQPKSASSLKEKDPFGRHQEAGYASPMMTQDFASEAQEKPPKTVTQQHVPILIEDQGKNCDKSSQGSFLPPGQPSPDLPQNQQSNELFSQDVFAKLEVVQQERQEQNHSIQSPEPESRIVKDGKDSNFFSSLVYESSPDKPLQQRTTRAEPEKQLNDMFRFLMEPSAAQDEKKTGCGDPNGSNGANPQRFDDWGEAFGVTQKLDKLSKLELNLVPLLGHGDQVESASDARMDDERKHGAGSGDAGKPGWGEDEELDDDELDMAGDERDDNDRHPQHSYNDEKSIDQAKSNQQTGEIMLEESLENSPIKKNKVPPIATGQIEISNQLQDSMSSSRHKRQKEIQPMSGKEAFLDGSLEQLGHDIGQRRQPVDSQEEDDENDDIVPQNEQRDSYRAAIDSFNRQESESVKQEEQQTFEENSKAQQDIDSETYDQLMEEEGKSQSPNDSMLENSSPFNNSYARMEVDLVVNAIRKNSLQEVSCDVSPLIPEEKKVNISNLSDLIPEEHSISEKLNDTDEEVGANGRLRPGELNEVLEVDDEQISDDMHASSSRNRTASQDQSSTHNTNKTATVLDMQSSSVTRRASRDYSEEKQKLMRHMSTPSMSESQNFDQQYLTKNEEVSPDVIKREASHDLELLIPSSPLQVHEQKVTSARFDHRRQQSCGDDLNPFVSKAVSETHGLTQKDSTESQGEDQQLPRYETLAEFTKENLIKYQADGKTESANVDCCGDKQSEERGEVEGEETADFDDAKQLPQDNQEDELSEESDQADKPPVAHNVNGSAFFTRDFRVLAKATYGNPDQGKMILQKLQEEHGFINSRDSLQSKELEDSHEQNVQSFAAPPVPEPELSACSIEAEQLLKEGNFLQLQNMSRESLNMESFENSAMLRSFERGSLIEGDARLNSLLGSMIQPGSMVEPMGSGLPRRGDENSIEEEDGMPEVEDDEDEDDGMPQVEDVYENKEYVDHRASIDEEDFDQDAGVVDDDEDIEDGQLDQESEGRDEGVDENLGDDFAGDEENNEEEVVSQPATDEADSIEGVDQAEAGSEDDPLKTSESAPHDGDGELEAEPSEPQNQFIDEIDAQSLETVAIANSTDVSPSKIVHQFSGLMNDVKDSIEDEAMDNVVKSNQQDSTEVVRGERSGAAGWEDDESLEEIEDAPEPRDYEGHGLEPEVHEDENLNNRSVSANEQMPAADQDEDAEDQVEAPSQSNAQLGEGDANLDQFDAGWMTAAEDAQASVTQQKQNESVRVATGWEENSDDLSIDDDEIRPIEGAAKQDSSRKEEDQVASSSPSQPSALFAQNEQPSSSGITTTKAPTSAPSTKHNEPDLQDLFGMAAKKQEQVIADPFSMFLTSTTTSSANTAADMASNFLQALTSPKAAKCAPQPASASGNEQAKDGNTGGGWGADDDSDIDIE